MLISSALFWCILWCWAGVFFFLILNFLCLKHGLPVTTNSRKVLPDVPKQLHGKRLWRRTHMVWRESANFLPVNKWPMWPEKMLSILLHGSGHHWSVRNNELANVLKVFVRTSNHVSLELMFLRTLKIIKIKLVWGQYLKQETQLTQEHWFMME